MKKEESLSAEALKNEKKYYQYWRRNIFLSIFVSWASFHFVRKSFSSIIPWLKSDLDFSITQIGLLSTIFYITYSVSKLLCGYVSDTYNARYVLSISLVISGITNIAFGASSSIEIMACCLVVSSFSQAFAWPTCTKLLTFWCDKKERGKWWGLCGVGQNLGAGLIPIFAGFISVYLSWRWAMYFSGGFGIIIGVLMTLTVRDVPTSLGLPPIEKYFSRETSINILLQKRETLIEVIKKHILTNIPLIVFSVAGLFLYIVRSAINDWIPLYLIEAKQYKSMIAANGTVSWFELGGLLGGVVACWASDTIFKGNRFSATFCLSLMLLVSTFIFYNIPGGYVMLDNFFMGTIGFLLFGFQSVFGLATSEMIRKSYAATANSFGGFVCNIGAAISGYPLALIVKNWGWDNFFSSIIFCCILIILLVLLTQSLIKKSKNKALRSTSW